MGNSPFHGRDGQTYSSEDTAINPPLPSSRATTSRTSQNTDPTRNAPMTGTRIPRDTVNINGNFKNGG